MSSTQAYRILCAPVFMVHEPHFKLLNETFRGKTAPNCHFSQLKTITFAKSICKFKGIRFRSRPCWWNMIRKILLSWNRAVLWEERPRSLSGSSGTRSGPSWSRPSPSPTSSSTTSSSSTRWPRRRSGNQVRRQVFCSAVDGTSVAEEIQHNKIRFKS